MNADVRVYAEQAAVNDRLAGLGLEEIQLRRPAQRGLGAWAACTPNHPPIFGGFWAWAETVCALREELVPLGWTRLNESNLPLVVNKELGIALSVATGDEDTGRKEGAPCTSSAKGPKTALAIRENLGQLILFPIEELPTDDIVNRSGRSTWILLIYRDTKARELRCELSRPINMAPDGHVIGWAERIILSATPFDGDALSIVESGSPTSPEIDLEIRKRV